MSDKTEDKGVSGRPLKYKTPQELQDAIDLFISDCPDKRKLVYEGNILEVPCPTISGLAYYLGFCDRQSLYDYEGRDAFSCIIKRARLWIETEYEKALQSNNVTGIIFALKQMGWSDKVESKNTSEIKVSNKDVLDFTKNLNETLK